MSRLETKTENITVTFLRKWLEKTHSQPKEWVDIVNMFFKCFQLTPAFKNEWMLGVPNPNSPEAIGYVRQIFDGFLNGLSKIQLGNELEDVYKLMWTINDMVLSEDGGEAINYDLSDSKHACTIIGEILIILEQPHQHPRTERRVLWCVKTQKAALFQAVSACKVILWQVGLEPENMP